MGDRLALSTWIEKHESTVWLQADIFEFNFILICLFLKKNTQPKNYSLRNLI